MKTLNLQPTVGQIWKWDSHDGIEHLYLFMYSNNYSKFVRGLLIFSNNDYDFNDVGKEHNFYFTQTEYDSWTLV